MTSYQERVKQFDKILYSDGKIDLKSLKEKSYRGIPEGNGRRSLTWRILLGYLPLDRDSWSTVVEQKRALYKQFVDEIIVQNPESNSPVIEDHPLNPNPNSNWQNFFKDNEVLLQIDKDVRRLYPDISFFSQPCEFPNQIVGSGYVQGMNEIIGPIYYVFATDSNTEWRGWFIKLSVQTFLPLIEIYRREHAEADCFFCFTNLMSDIRDFFIKTLDDSPTGIRMLMVRLDKMLESADSAVHNVLQTQGIKMPYFAFRWLSLMLSQEFSLPDVLSLWDALLTDDTRCDLLMDVCIAMLKLIRNELLTNDFATNMKLLQNYPGIDIMAILEQAKSSKT